MNKKRRLALWIMFIVYLILLIDVILLKHGEALMISEWLSGRTWGEKIESINFIPFTTIIDYCTGRPGINVSIQNIVGNIIAFSPLGFLLPILVKKFANLKAIICVSFSISLLIEITQLVCNLGTADIDDLILNTFGAIIGFAVFRIINKRYMGKLENA